MTDGRPLQRFLRKVSPWQSHHRVERGPLSSSPIAWYTALSEQQARSKEQKPQDNYFQPQLEYDGGQRFAEKEHQLEHKDGPAEPRLRDSQLLQREEKRRNLQEPEAHPQKELSAFIEQLHCELQVYRGLSFRRAALSLWALSHQFVSIRALRESERLVHAFEPEPRI